MSHLLPIGIALAVAGALLVLGGLVSLFQVKVLRFTVRTLAGLLLVALGALSGAVALGVQGYRALTREDVAARLSVKPGGPQRLVATLRFPDGRLASYDIAGDEIYVDARILKWKSYANFFGLHTAYELDRIAGRYRDIQQEKTAPRTVYPLGEERPIDLFALRRRYVFLEPVLDAEYGSGTFVAVTRPTELEVRVSTTGLLLREVESPGGGVK